MLFSAEEIDRLLKANLQRQEKEKERLSSLPKGYLYYENRGLSCYVYLKCRTGMHINCRYLGKKDSPYVIKAEENRIRYAVGKRNLARLKKEEQGLRKLMKTRLLPHPGLNYSNLSLSHI